MIKESKVERRRRRKNELQRKRRHITGINKPVRENTMCARYLGEYIAETLLEKMFDNPKRMPTNNRWYDFICRKRLKIDVKASCIRKTKCGKNLEWAWGIRKNKIADYFLFMAFNTKQDLLPLHLWLLKSDQIIRTGEKETKLNDKHVFHIACSERIIIKYQEFELIDKLNKAKGICALFKGMEAGHI